MVRGQKAAWGVAGLTVLLAATASTDTGRLTGEPADHDSAESRVAKVDYWLHCGGCHLLDGRSAPPEVPTLIGEPGRILSLPGGREYLVRIPGVAQSGLDDERLAGVLNFMLQAFSTKTLDADFEPYTAVEIERSRGAVLQDPLRRRREIVESVASP